MIEQQNGRVYIFDTTLRDGEQTPGVFLAPDEKLVIARQLARLRVDVIEAGMPVTSPHAFRAVEMIARSVRGVEIAALSRALIPDVDTTWEAIKGADDPRIHVFISSSDIHLMHQLEKDRQQVMEMAVSAVKRARSHTPNVEFSPMDATRTDRPFLYALLEGVIQAGATVVNIPDTVGYALLWEFEELVKDILINVPNIDRAIISVHCHNDQGDAKSNSMMAVHGGARQVEVCVNGIGERAGNASLEQVAISFMNRPDLLGDDQIGIDFSQIKPTSELVSELTCIPVHRLAPAVGTNVFRHGSGIHQHGVLKLRETYEIMDPERLGWSKHDVNSHRFVFSPTMGKAGFYHIVTTRYPELTQSDIGVAFQRFREIDWTGKDASNPDIADEQLSGIIEGLCLKGGE
ncbi:2-isopropylmalate synthase [Candidatus Daviesbacteria bacterium]|nr:2-isopropylmalate synthase [Candidatus Daviesbacteria bacterium]